MPPLHDDELVVDSALVRRLVGRSMPEYAHLDIRPLRSTGSSNALFRLGDSLLVRLPRQPGGSTTIEKEARWLPEIATALTVSVPEVVAVGEPGFGYPERWSVTKWLEGQTPTVPWKGASGATSQGLALGLARLLTELHRLDVPPAATHDPALAWYRGGRLVDLDDDFHAAVDGCRSIDDLGLDLDVALDVWQDVLSVELDSAPRTAWFHGDLLAENLLVHDGELGAVLDFGGLGVGDPAVDLVVAWETLDAAGRQTLREAAGVDDVTWAKGMGWALLIAVITFPYYWHTMPARCASRRQMASTVLAEACWA